MRAKTCTSTSASTARSARRRAEELYSNGTHVATQSVELGHPALDAETANRAELGVHWHTGPVELAASIYHVRYDDFIYLDDTGDSIEEDLPVRQWTQGDARFNGAEGGTRPGTSPTTRRAGGIGAFTATSCVPRWSTTAICRASRRRASARNSAGNGRLARVGECVARATAGSRRGVRNGDAGLHDGRRAPRVAHGYEGTANACEFFLDGTNLLDEEARAHTSFLKDVAPLPGRGFAFGVRTFF